MTRKVLPFGPTNAEILIVGEAPGAEEEKVGQPFIGVSGQELTRMLAEAGIPRSKCRLTNVTSYRPKGNDIEEFFPNKREAKTILDNGGSLSTINGRVCTNEIVEGLLDLEQEIATCKPRLIITLGSTALWALTGELSITSWRGSMMWCKPNSKSPMSLSTAVRVLPTYHPAAILRQWSWRAVAVHDLRKASKFARADSWPMRNQTFSIKPDLAEVLLTIEQFRAAKRPFSCDIETTNRNISLLAIANSPDNALCIPLMTRHSADNCYWTEHEEHAIIVALRGLLQDRECGCIGQNFHYDAQYLLRHWGIYPFVVDDTMWMQHVLFPGLPKSLDFLASMYCEPYVYWKDELKDYRQLPEDEDKFRNYNCLDACYTYEIWQKLSKVIQQTGLSDQYAFQMSLFNPVLDMMSRGIKVDTNKRADLTKQVRSRIKELETFLETLVGTHVGVDPSKCSKWYRSSQQMQRLFYEEMGFKPSVNRKTQKATIDDEALEKIAIQSPLLRPLCDALKEYSSLDTFSTTFLDAKIDSDSRMRCSYNVAGTETYRFSSSQNAFGSGLNLQNLPRSAVVNIRSMFVPDTGYVLLDFDLSSADLRVVVKESGAKKVQAILDSGNDVYSTLASECFNEQVSGKKHPLRQTFKNVAHALDYVAGARTISATYGLPLSNVEKLKAWYFFNNPEIPKWHVSVDREIRSTRRVRNKFGYQRTYFDRVETLLSAATAWIGQSTVAITINRGLVNLYRNLPWVEILLQVHDSLVVQIPIEKFTTENVRLIQRELLIPIPFNPPLVIPVNCKASTRSWGECQDFPL